MLKLRHIFLGVQADERLCVLTSSSMTCTLTTSALGVRLGWGHKHALNLRVLIRHFLFPSNLYCGGLGAISRAISFQTATLGYKPPLTSSSATWDTSFAET